MNWLTSALSTPGISTTSGLANLLGFLREHGIDRLGRRWLKRELNRVAADRGRRHRLWRGLPRLERPDEIARQYEPRSALADSRRRDADLQPRWGCVPREPLVLDAEVPGVRAHPRFAQGAATEHANEPGPRQTGQPGCRSMYLARQRTVRC